MFGFTGEPSDATGLIDLRARMLDPSTGRFLSADTVSPNAPGTGGYNLYAYSANNPATWTDPSGHFVEPGTFTISEINLATALEAQITRTVVGETVAATGACEVTAGNAPNGRVGCVDAGAAVLATRLFNISAYIFGAIFRCVGTPGCLGTVLALMSVMSTQGSSGEATQHVDGVEDPERPGVDEPSPSPLPVPGPIHPVSDDGPDAGQLIYRVFGGGSQMWGQSWSPVDPRLVQHNPILVAQWGRYAYRAAAGLPDGNSGSYMVIARLRTTVGIVSTTAASVPTKLHPDGVWPGRLPEYFFTSPPVPGVNLDYVSDEPLVPHY
jgi:RHS repeat-associated protein